MGMRETVKLCRQFGFIRGIASAAVVTAGLTGAPTHAFGAEPGQVAPNLPGAEDEPAQDDRVDQLEQRLMELSDRLKQSEERQRVKAESPLSIHGYVDFGFFAPMGNHGAGFVEDVGHMQFPQYSQYSWMFLGDILGSPVNSRGEAASLGNPPGVNRFDSVNSNGAPGFIANEVNLRLGYALSERALLRTSVNFVPRTGHEFALGDFVEVDLAEMEYVLTADGNTSLFVGKMLPVLGIEYKERKSDQRFGITPSLVHRYTSGSQLGLKLRSKLFQEWVILAGSVTDNSSGIEQFHFSSEIDRNSGKTVNGRAALSVPVGDLTRIAPGDRLELGASGEIGPQDFATNNAQNIFFWGVDLQYIGTNIWLKAQFLRGKAPGTADGTAWQLDLHSSGYVELDWQALGWLGFMGRAEQRDAFVAQGTDRAYLTKQRRFTVGGRFVVNPHIIVKAEYLANVEYGGIAAIDNNMFTSSLVLAY